MPKYQPGPASGSRHPSWAVFTDWPPDPNRPPSVDGQYATARIGGARYVCLFGSPQVVMRRFTLIAFDTWAEVRRYQDKAVRERGVGFVAGYSAVWRLTRGIKERKPGPAAKKEWEGLAESTKRGYRGVMRRQLGLRTEAEFKAYYEGAEDLGALRRHPTLSFIAGGERLTLARKSDAEPIYLITWQKHG